MNLIPSLIPLIATCGVLVGIYTPISLSALSSNSASFPEEPRYIPTSPKGHERESESDLLFRKRLSIEEPILSCNDYGKKYEVYLATSGWEGAQEWTKESAKGLLTFKIVDVKNESVVVWGPEARADNKWSNWTIRFSSEGGVTLGVPYRGGDYVNLNHQSLSCQVKKLNKVIEGEGREVTVSAVRGQDINANVLKVEVNLERCDRKGVYSKEEECEIQFASGVNLRWEGISPKAIFKVLGDK